MTKNLGITNLIGYILAKSKLQSDEFTFTMPDENDNSFFVVIKDNKMICLGQFTYGTLLRTQYAQSKSDLKAIQRFLDLCIQKIEDPKIIVPPLGKKPENWDKIYK